MCLILSVLLYFLITQSNGRWILTILVNFPFLFFRFFTLLRFSSITLYILLSFLLRYCFEHQVLGLFSWFRNTFGLIGFRMLNFWSLSLKFWRFSFNALCFLQISLYLRLLIPFFFIWALSFMLRLHFLRKFL